MSETEPTYKITFHRPAEIWRDGWAECEGIGRVNYRMGLEFGPKLVCRLIKMNGLPDGDFSIQEVHAKVPLSSYLPSVYSMAGDGSNFSHMTRDMYFSIKNKTNLLTPDLLSRGYVTPDGTVTDIGLEAASLYFDTMEKQAPSVSLTPHQREGFSIVATTPEKWKDMHGKTQNLMLASGWVEMQGKTPVLTGLGQNIYQTVVMNAPVQTTAGAPSEGLIRSLKTIRDNPNEWANLGGRVKGDLKSRGFVEIENKSYALINSAGLEAIAEFEKGGE